MNWKDFKTGLMWGALSVAGFGTAAIIWAATVPLD